MPRSNQCLLEMCVCAHCTSSPGRGEGPAGDSLALHLTDATFDLLLMGKHHHQGLTGEEKATGLPLAV